jgi:PAS domain S-box-containing protein
MTQRKKIAIAFLFALPVVLVIVFVEHVALLRVSGNAGRMALAAEILHESNAINSLLNEADAQTQKYIAAGGDNASRNLYQSAVSQLNGNLHHLHELTRSDPATQAHLQALDPLVAQRIALSQQEMGPIQKGLAPAQNRAALGVQGQKLRDEIDKIIADTNAPLLIRLRQQGEAADRSARTTEKLTTYGGTLAIWLIGVAAFLLFHDEKKLTWDGVERRVHTKILEALPLGVCLTTDSGLVIYNNPAEESLFGYQPGNMIGQNMADLHAPDGNAPGRSVSTILDQLKFIQIWAGELPIRRKDGTTRKAASWIMNMEIPGKNIQTPTKHYRIFVHNPNS